MLCKSLKENPRIADNLHKMQVERQSLQAMLMKVQKELAVRIGARGDGDD